MEEEWQCIYRKVLYGYDRKVREVVIRTGERKSIERCDRMFIVKHDSVLMVLTERHSRVVDRKTHCSEARDEVEKVRQEFDGGRGRAKQRSSCYACGRYIVDVAGDSGDGGW